VQYRGGLTDFNRVALLEQNLVQQQDLYAQAIGDIAVGLVRTYRALGGGWEIRCNNGAMYETASMPPEAVAAPDGATDLEELPPGKNPSLPLPSKEPKRQPTPALRYPDSAVPKGAPPPDSKPTAPGELIKPNEVPPRSAPTKLPDLGPEVMPDEDVFGPGKPQPKADEKKPPFFDQPNPPPADDVFGPAEIPSKQNSNSKSGSETKPNGSAKKSPPQASRRRPPARWQVRPAGGQGKPNQKPRNPSYVQHAGLLPEDRGEVRRVR
jgi:hypothetical protein